MGLLRLMTKVDNDLRIEVNEVYVIRNSVLILIYHTNIIPCRL